MCEYTWPSVTLPDLQEKHSRLLEPYTYHITTSMDLTQRTRTGTLWTLKLKNIKKDVSHHAPKPCTKPTEVTLTLRNHFLHQHQYTNYPSLCASINPQLLTVLLVN